MISLLPGSSGVGAWCRVRGGGKPATVAWASDAWKHYERLAEEADKIAARASDDDLKSALQNEKRAAAEVAEQLKKLAEAAASKKASQIPLIKAALSSAAQAEQAAARSLEKYCTE